MEVWAALLLIGGTGAVAALGYLLVRRLDAALAAGRWTPRAAEDAPGTEADRMSLLGLLKPKADVTFLYDDQTLRQGIEMLRACGEPAVPVLTSDGRYAGTLREGDLLWHLVGRLTAAGEQVAGMEAPECCALRDILREDDNPAVRVGAGLDELRRRVIDVPFVPVTDGRGLFLGIVTRRDVLRAADERDTVDDGNKTMSAP